MRLYQEVAFNDPVLNSARFNYAANKEIYWQGLSTLLPQVSANPTATRFFQHGEGNSRIFDQKSYTVSLTQPVFNAAALEVFKQGDLITKVSDLQFLQAQQDLVIRVSQAYFDVLTAQESWALPEKRPWSSSSSKPPNRSLKWAQQPLSMPMMRRPALI